MTPEQYWEGEADLVIAYRKAYKLRMQKENRDMWLQGLYYYRALCDVSPVLHAFAENGTKPHDYLSEPIALTAKEAEERRVRDERLAYERLKAGVAAWAAQQNEECRKGVTDDG